MLLSDWNVDNQFISILVAVVRNVQQNDAKMEPIADQMLSSVKYSSISSVLRQCDRNRNIYSEVNQNTLSTNCAGGHMNCHNNEHRGGQNVGKSQAL